MIVPDTMQAIRLQAGEVVLETLPVPVLGRGEVLIKVACAGLCRTDLYVAQGRIPAKDPVVLGHEFSGVVVDGAGLKVGTPVAVFPWFGCGACAWCLEGEHVMCRERRMIGVHRDGGFAEMVAVPEECVYPLPGAVDLRSAVFAEPVAACLGVIKAPISRSGRGLVLGNGRVSSLLARILRLKGYSSVVEREVDYFTREPPPTGSDSLFDWAVDTTPRGEGLNVIASWMKPGSVVVLRSRSPEPPRLDLEEAMVRELTLKTVFYGDFSHSLDLLAGDLQVDDLCSQAFSWEDFIVRLRGEEQVESCKALLVPNPELMEQVCAV